MQTYIERSTQLALDSSVAVQVLMGTNPDDVTFVPLKPRGADEHTWAELRASWPGRGLRSVGTIGLVGLAPVFEPKEDLSPAAIEDVAVAFVRYVLVQMEESLAAQRAATEVAELNRLYQLPDTRPN